jgi:predicted transcriptional regulator
MKPNANFHVTDYELAVLQVLWASGPATVRQITEQVYPEVTTVNYATVQKLLQRLEDKGMVRRDARGHVHRYSAAIERGVLVDTNLKALADKLCDGSLTPLLMHLVQGARLSAEERRQLRQLLDKPEGRTGEGKPAGGK